MKYNRGFSIIVVLIILGLVTGIVVMVAVVGPKNIPMLNFIDQKLRAIITPRPPAGNLAPARDLVGTWRSSIRGKGVQLYGQFDAGPGTTKIYEDGDIELIINNVNNNTAAGTVRYTNLCSSGTTTVPGFANVSVPKQCVSNTGANPIQIRVSSSHLDFGTINTGGAAFTMQGNYTTDIISGTMTATTYSGIIKGEFHLIRVH